VVEHSETNPPAAAGLKRSPKWIDVLFGPRLASSEQSERKIGVLAGVPALGLDGLGSSAYGPEAALAILLPLGAAGLRYIGPITLVLLALLAALYASYRQTISAYPAGGGAYTVAKENLGVHAGLLAAAALLIDYVLNVAVGISAGIGALVSAVPRLHPYTLLLCLAVLAVITLVNLRGTVESGIAFALPTYLFLTSFGAVLAVGLAHALASGGHPRPLVPPPALPHALEAASAWIVLRAFASGCTAMTGVEAVSNGVSAFREPPVKHAHGTLTVIVASLGILLGGIAYLVRAFHVGAMDQTKPGYQSVLAQLAAAAVGRGALYYVAIGSLLAVLSLSANTSFVDFPRLCRLIAKDGFLPVSFAAVGRRLVFSVGILFLCAASGLLLAVFGGITDRLIPLFAVGAFLAFTMSQAGMVMHWWKRRGGEERGRRGAWHLRLGVNAVGALTTAIALGVILAAKFLEGAWITVLAIPSLLFVFRSIRRYYERVAAELDLPGGLDLSDNQPPVVVLPIRRWNKLTGKALRFAMRLSPDVIAVHLGALEAEEGEDEAAGLRQRWSEEVEGPARQASVPPPRLVLVQSPYRQFVAPLVRFLAQVEREHPGRPIALLVPELVKSRWWQLFLHNRRTHRLRAALLRGEGTPRTVVIEVPWYLEAGGDREADGSSKADPPAAG
jgi:amino acid transporter